MILIQVKCDQCGKLFEKEAKYVARSEKYGWKHYCSKECQSISKTLAIDTFCFTCGKPIKVRLSDYNRSKSGNNYCSKSCSNSMNNRLCPPRNINDESSSYRTKALRYYGSKCSVCGYDIEDVLQVHHRDCNRGHNEIENLDVLCPTHHVEYQLGIRKYE